MEGDWRNRLSRLGGPVRFVPASLARSNSSGFLLVRGAPLAPWLSVIWRGVLAKLLPKLARAKSTAAFIVYDFFLSGALKCSYKQLLPGVATT